MMRILFFSVLLASTASGQEVVLTLSDALRIAGGKSEQVAIARAGVRRAEGEQVRARAQRLPDITGSLGYTRTLATEFSQVFNTEQAESCPPLSVDPNAPVPERVSEIERALLCGGISPFGQGAAGRLPFGRTNIWRAGASFTQALYAGGRIAAQNRLAGALREAAGIELSSANAQFFLDVTQAFYDAALAQELLRISLDTLRDATRTLEYVRLAHEVGRQPEFDVLRADVARRNQLPEVARRRAAANQSAMRLAQLLELPQDSVFQLESDLMSEKLAVPQFFEAQFAAAAPLRQVLDRAPVRQSDSLVRQREAGLDAARAQRLPSVSVISDYGLVAYPSGFFPTSTNHFRNNWTVGATLQTPLFRGGRIKADIVSAEAALEEALALRKQTRELAAFDTRVALDQLRTAEEQWEAITGTVDEASRAYQIASLRYQEGISSQIELDDALLSLRQARVNRAQAARDLQIARVTVALLPMLPINTNPLLPGQPQTPLRPQAPFGGQPQIANPNLLQLANPAQPQFTPAALTPAATTAASGGIR